MGAGNCTKCNCPAFHSGDLGVFADGYHGEKVGWIVRPSRKCFCGHAMKAHRALGGYGAISSSASEGTLCWSHGAASQAEAEEMVLRKHDQPDAVIRVWGCNMFLAIARADGGGYSWSGGETREVAERRALEACSGLNPEIQLSFHTRLNQPKQWFSS